MKISLLDNKDILLLGMLAFFLALGQLQRLAVPWGAQYIHELVLILFLYNKRSKLTKIARQTWQQFSPFSKLLLGFILVGITINWLSNGEIRPVLLSFRAFLYLGTAWVVYQSLANKYKHLLRLFLLVSGVIMALTGALQYILLPDVRFLAVLGWDDHYYRAVGSMLDPNYLGIIMVFTLANLWSWSKKLPNKLIIISTFVLSVIIATTFSRATFLAAATLFALQFLTNKKLVIIATISLLITLAILPKPTGEGVDLLRTSSITSRVTHDQNVLQNTRLKPINILFGSGLFSSTHRSQRIKKSFDHGLQANNFFVFLYQSFGVVGTILVLPILILGIKIVYRKQAIFAFALLAIFVHSQFNNSFFEPIVFSYWTLTLATLTKPKVEK